MKRNKKNLLHGDHIVEVVMKKKMKMIDYEKLIPQVKKKGWNIQGYQEEFYSDGTKLKIDNKIIKLKEDENN